MPLTPLVPSPFGLLLIDFTLVIRDVIFQVLNLILQLSNLLLNLRLDAVRGAFSPDISLLVDNGGLATMGWDTVLIRLWEKASSPGADWWAGVYQGGRLGFAAAFEAGDGVITHG